MTNPQAAAIRNAENLSERFQNVREFTEELVAPLSAEDCALQSMPDVSPTKWHLAHTTWFFETFLLRQMTDYQPFDDSYVHLFNSYYNTVGEQFPRSKRGLLSRPSLAVVREYRRHVDDQMLNRLLSHDTSLDGLEHVIETGLQHEQQHQELILTDIKHVLSQSPLAPSYRASPFAEACDPTGQEWLCVNEGLYEIGHSGNDFCFDNELPKHRVLVESFKLSNRLVTCGEYLQFMDDGGYERPELWLSLGWTTASERGWHAPRYWNRINGTWREFTLGGSRPVDPTQPVCHVSYFEADAFARWAGCRLPTEAEWEVASSVVDRTGNFVDTLLDAGLAIHPCTTVEHPAALFGNVWQWTASPYVAFPGYAPPEGALGEYNGKFMCNQFVLRGGSCATHSTHIRHTYRNFFPPEAQWQFSGIRLARS